MTSAAGAVVAAFALLLFLAAGPVPVRAQTPEFELTETKVDIAPGTTMFELVRDFYPNHRNDWLRVARDLADANPDAFRNGDPGALIVGQTIQLIDYGDGVATDARATPGVPDTPDTTADVAPDAEPDADQPDAEEPAAPPARPAIRSIATITRLRGAPIAIDRNNRERTLKPNATIYRGDTLLTGDDEPVSLVMQDGAVIRVRANSRLMFEKYRTDDAAGGERGGVMTLSAGGLRLTTGDLAELRNGILINTAVATLSTTGGDLALALCDDGACAPQGSATPAAPGLYAGVALGELSVSNNTGTATAARGEVLRVRNADLAPTLASDLLGVVFDTNELLALDLQPDEPMGFFAWFRQRFFSFSPSPSAGTTTDEP